MISEWSSAGWWTGVSGLATVLALVWAIWVYYRPRPAGPGERRRPGEDGVARTPWLGLQLYQDGKRVLMSTQRRGRHDLNPLCVAPLRSGRFELHLARLPRDVGLHIAAWTDDSIQKLRDGMPLDETVFFVPGTGLADTGAGSEALVLDPEAHNYLVGERLATVSDQVQAVHVADLRQGLAPIRKPWGDIYLTIMQDGDDPDGEAVDLSRVEFLKLSFS
jgi:hypothetical protein